MVYGTQNIEVFWIHTSIRERDLREKIFLTCALILNQPRNSNTLFIFCKTVVFPAQAEYSYFYAEFRGRPFNSWGRGWVILKKISCKRLSEEKHCMQNKSNRKKFLHCCKKEKKCCKAISSFRGGFTNPNRTATILFPCSLWTLDFVMLQNYWAYVQAVIEVNFSIKESRFNRQRKLTFLILNF